MDLMTQAQKTIFLTAPRGLIPVLRDEIIALDYKIDWAGDTGIGLRGTYSDAMYLNLWLRTAHHVLYQLAEFSCTSLDELYKNVNRIEWESIIPVNGYLSVVAIVDHPSIRDHRIVNMKCKDSIVDRIAERKGRRPNSGPEKDGVVISLFWKQDRCRVYLDTSGEPLSKRGYRQIPLGAPMQETLAAGIVLASSYSGDENFVNPMCGSGTIAIEAAQIATHRAPGLTRDYFGFMHTLLYDAAAWNVMRKEAVARAVAKPAFPVIATDREDQAIAASEENARIAGVDGVISFSVAPFIETPIPEGDGVIFFNPEYGIRMGDENVLVETYRSIGNFMKAACAGYRGYIFTGNVMLAGQVGLKSRKKQQFQSGKIECRLYEYDLYKRPVSR